MPHAVRIATRGSQLALWQARHVAALLARLDADLQPTLVEISTKGDRVQDNPLRQFGGLGVFTREVQQAVLDGRADLAVHSLKDLPTEPADGLTLAAVPERASPEDALVLPQGAEYAAPGIEALPPNARVGTGSPRRQAQLWAVRPDLKIEEVRGNVDTRLRKLDQGEYDALVLAEAGLTRLGFAGRISALFPPMQMLPAVGQGALGIECRADDFGLQAILKRLTDEATWSAVIAERSLLRSLRAGCHSPLGVRTAADNGTLTLTAALFSLDGQTAVRATATRPTAEATQLGMALAEELRQQGADRLLSQPLEMPPRPGTAG